MKLSSKILFSLLGFGILYSMYRALSGEGGSGLYDFVDAMAYTSMVVSVSSVVVLCFNLKNYKKHLDTFILFLLGLPLTIIAVMGFTQDMYLDRDPDLTPKYRLHFSQEQLKKESMIIKVQIDSLVAAKNRIDQKRFSHI